MVKAQPGLLAPPTPRAGDKTKEYHNRLDQIENKLSRASCNNPSVDSRYFSLEPFPRSD